MLRFIACLLLSFSVGISAEPTLRQYAAEYTVHLSGVKVGELSRSLQHLGDGEYLLETRAYTTGFASWFKPDEAVSKTRWSFIGGQPVPHRFDYHYSGRRSERVEWSVFDWERGVVKSKRRGRTTELELEEGVLDTQVFEVVMQQGLAKGLQRASHQVVSRGRIADYEYEVLGHEIVVTRPFGEVDTVKVQRGDTTMWLAPAHDYIVVRIRQRDGGNTANSYITQVSYH